MFRHLLLAGLVTSTSPYAADVPAGEEVQETSPLSTEVEFGYRSHSGNSDTQSLNARGDTEYVTGRYRYSGEIKLYKLDKNGKEDKRQTAYQVQTDYKLATNIYLYGNFKGVDSKYSAYFEDHTFSAGLGYHNAFGNKLIFELELGPGYRYQEPNLDEIDDDDIIFPDTVQEPILRSNINVDWQALDKLSLSADITTIAGNSNTNIYSELSAINSITEDIALKISHSRQYHDKVPEGLNNSDSVFTANLLFLF